MARTPKPANIEAAEQSVSVQLPTEIVLALDAAASERVLGRGYLLRYFIEQGLKNLPPLPSSGVLLMPKIIEVNGNESPAEIRALIAVDQRFTVAE